MKTRFIFGLLILASLELFGQSSDIKVIQNQRVIGQNLLTHQEIFAKQYQFPKEIYKKHLDSTSGNLTLQLRKLRKTAKVYAPQGQVVVFNLHSNTVNWSKKINYTTGTIEQYGNLITFSRENKIDYLNNDTGMELWSDKNDIYYVDKDNNIGVQYIKNDKSKIQGINLNNGNSLWQRDITRAYGWNKLIKMNDSILLIAAGGLHSLNIKNGTGWDYNTVTGKKDYTETIAKNVVGVALGVLTGTAVISAGANLVRDVASNVLIEGNYVYFASKEKVSKINKSNGDISWTYPLDEKTTSKSLLFKKDSLVFMINQGYANFGNKKINFGDPFILALNTETGNQEFSRTVGTKDDFILDYKTGDDKLVLVLKDRILSLSLLNNTEIKEQTCNTSDFGELKFFAGSKIYKRDTSNLSNLVTSDSTKYFVQTNKGLTLALDNDFKVSNQYNNNDLYYYYNATTDYNFFLKGDRDQTIICDKNNSIIAELKGTNFMFSFGDKLYCIDGKSLSIIDINDIVVYN